MLASIRQPHQSLQYFTFQFLFLLTQILFLQTTHDKSGLTTTANTPQRRFIRQFKAPTHFMRQPMNKITTIVYLSFVVFIFRCQTHRREEQKLFYVFFDYFLSFYGEKQGQICTERMANKCDVFYVVCGQNVFETIQKVVQNILQMLYFNIF